MKKTFALLLVLSTIQASASADLSWNLLCDVRMSPTQIVRLKLARSKDSKTCDATMIDARGGAMTGTYYVVWDCSYTPIEANKKVQVGAYVLKSPSREGIGPEQEAVKLLSLTVDEIGSSGGGIYVIENDVVGSLLCKPDDEFVRPEF